MSDVEITEQELINVPNEVLAANIVVYRALGINKNLAISCMVELVKRRNAGDNFDYESFIEKKLLEFPNSEKNDNIIKTIKEIQRQIGIINGRVK